MNIVPWNVVSGCERITPGCDNCPTYWEYKKKDWDYHPKSHAEVLSQPSEIQEPSAFIVAAGSDLFHESVRLEFIEQVFQVMREHPHHYFEVGTKRIERMAVLSGRHLEWPDNAFAITAVEEAKYKWRIDILREIEARRMVSFGPMTGRVGKVNLSGIKIAAGVVEHWGPYPRAVKQKWVEEIYMQCKKQNVKISQMEWVCKESA